MPVLFTTRQENEHFIAINKEEIIQKVPAWEICRFPWLKWLAVESQRGKSSANCEATWGILCDDVIT
jgi:hypothetical protein